MAKKRLPPSVVEDKAKKVSKSSKASFNAYFRVIFAAKGYEGKELTTKSCSAFQQYKRSGRVFRYAEQAETGRFIVNDNQEYKAISDIYDFLDTDYKTRKSPKTKKVSKKRGAKKNIGSKVKEVDMGVSTIIQKVLGYKNH